MKLCEDEKNRSGTTPIHLNTKREPFKFHSDLNATDSLLQLRNRGTNGVTSKIQEGAFRIDLLV